MPLDFSVVYAFAFCCGVFFRGALGWAIPLVTTLISDLGLNLYYQHVSPEFHVWSFSHLAALSVNYLAYALLILIGRQFKPRSSLMGLIGGGMLGAMLFYFISNTAAWLMNPEYPKNLAGWIQALTKGINGYPPTWEFFRNTLMSGGLFTALFGVVGQLTAAESPADKSAGARAPENEAAQPESEAAPEEAKA